MRYSAFLMRLTTLLAVLLFVAGCDGEVTADPESKITDIKLSDFKLKLPETPDNTSCTAPKPKNMGCTTIGKPCTKFMCKDGEWVSIEEKGPDFLDDIPDRPDPPDLTACPLTETRFCPAECSICY